MPTTIHLAGEPRNDGSQRCSRCGLEVLPAGHRDHWPVGQYVEVDEQEGHGVTVRAVQRPAGDDPPLCVSASSTDATATQPHRLGDESE